MSWAQRELGARLVDDGSGEEPLERLVTVALRRNPRRAHLLVSAVLGKHVPVHPSVVLGSGARLGEAVRARIGTDEVAFVLGYAETATALGHCVAATLRAPSLHSTRRLVEGVEPWTGFEEEHSHATAHQLLPDDPGLGERDGVVVLVDDEVSTGRTALNTIRALHGAPARRRYVLACLVDVRDARCRADVAALAASLGVRIDVVALASGAVELPVGFAPAAGMIAARVREPRPASTALRADAARSWPAGVRDGGRHGFGPEDDDAARGAAARCAADLAVSIGGPRVLVLGFEELMYAPLLVADALAHRLGARADVRFSSTTRSPVVVVDEPGYPVRSALRFAAHDALDDAPRYAYNVAPAAGRRGFDDVVVVVDDVADTPQLREGLLAQVAAVCDRVHLLVVPSHRPVATPAGPA